MKGANPLQSPRSGFDSLVVLDLRRELIERVGTRLARTRSKTEGLSVCQDMNDTKVRWQTAQTKFGMAVGGIELPPSSARR
jgi:hypothetical protein